MKMIYLQKLLAIATLYDYHIHQMNVTTTFLLGVLQEVIFIIQPNWYIQQGAESEVYRLFKSLYGLKQALQV